jgi:hypothetical protein
MWLVLNGVVLLKWDEVTSLSITDWQGNTVFLPITASVCMILSIIAVIKVSQTQTKTKAIVANLKP